MSKKINIDFYIHREKNSKNWVIQLPLKSGKRLNHRYDKHIKKIHIRKIRDDIMKLKKIPFPKYYDPEKKIIIKPSTEKPKSDIKNSIKPIFDDIESESKVLISNKMLKEIEKSSNEASKLFLKTYQGRIEKKLDDLTKIVRKIYTEMIQNPNRHQAEMDQLDENQDIVK